MIRTQQKLKSKGRKDWANTDCHCRKTFMMKAKVGFRPHLYYDYGGLSRFAAYHLNLLTVRGEDSFLQRVFLQKRVLGMY